MGYGEGCRRGMGYRGMPRGVGGAWGIRERGGHRGGTRAWTRGRGR